MLDSMAEGAEGVALASVLCNRALCYQKMDLHRKALKVVPTYLHCCTSSDKNLSLKVLSCLNAVVLATFLRHQV